ncbi:MAG TPA: hypothetical protein DDZ89_15135 [Clostridiales bacterium]|nr:hypothetical protein [Clostridiales bacterium]
MSYQSISRRENGSTYPDMELLPHIASIFEITVDELLVSAKRRTLAFPAIVKELMILLKILSPFLKMQ